MSVSFLRIDDRMIHGQTVTRWSLEYPCDGLIAVNDKAATTDALKMAYKSASTKKTFVWTYEAWKKKNQKVLDSKDNYFLITKDPIQMKKILVDDGFVPSDVKKVIVGPCNDRPEAVKLGNNQSITQEEAEALEAISKAGYEIEFALIKEASIGTWDKFRGQFGFNCRSCLWYRTWRYSGRCFSRCGNAGCIYRIGYTRRNCISRRSCRILYRYSTGNVSIKFIRIRSCISKRYLHGNIIWSNGRNNRYSIILWNSNDQPCMAAHWMAGR